MSAVVPTGEERNELPRTAKSASELSGLGPQVGGDVLLWGAGLPVETVADCAGTVPYELLCGISQRVPLALEESHFDAG